MTPIITVLFDVLLCTVTYNLPPHFNVLLLTINRASSLTSSSEASHVAVVRTYNNQKTKPHTVNLELRPAGHTNNLGYDQHFSFELRPNLELRPACRSRGHLSYDPHGVSKLQSEPRYACLWT
jgi:hypothetical protein